MHHVHFAFSFFALERIEVAPELWIGLLSPRPPRERSRCKAVWRVAGGVGGAGADGGGGRWLPWCWSGRVFEESAESKHFCFRFHLLRGASAPMINGWPSRVLPPDRTLVIG